ncbi:hypothetical protein CCR83_02860 [Rhodobacter veldkampii DSM 11550]|uniref:LPS-assembly protein LptD n=1 Tax=Phaeovulum veldkampii DSM 11550 TaxID=1185920 RepID=A0A2T4JK67_9RHOB|nr:LPS assembly protein LptD [Phaeovulum veldkampii]MBK5945412.1 hypothetical protein [Phaeovulum veldkampii DSM 11550]PTE18282.1 LPS-assembly protein LptD [Phaeovulum veldkampii DSM 11550]TDQ57758.1 LPS-assembly protein [Phaeovulum veldkampii DSM 11550]
MAPRRPCLPLSRLSALVLAALPLAALAPAPLPAQEAAPRSAARSDAATVLADRVYLSGDNRLTAEGAVEVWYRGNRLTASRIVYDQTTDRLTLDGPIRLTEPGAAGTVLVADSANLSADLRDGVLRGARLVLARELQLAADTITRVSGRHTTLERVVASSCQICADDPTPLWEIRARRVTHDTETRQLTFDGAQFRAMGLPIAYLPRLRMPDPTVERMSGFLRPTLRSTSGLGTGIKLPYFLALGDSRDLTITPYISTNATRTLEARYRQAFGFGDLEVSGAVSDDDILEEETRGYLFADGDFNLPGDFRLGVDLRLTTDDAYLLDYDVSDDDRLWSGVTLERVRTDQLIWARLGNTHSLRESESNSTEPMLAGDANLVQVWRPATIGGELVLDWQLHGHRRASDLDGDPGRDIGRASVSAEWRRNWLLPQGVLASGIAGLAADLHNISQDSNFDPTVTNILPAVAVELRWPWVKTSGRAAHVIEPVAQLIWSRDSLNDLPNEDSLLVEFDEGNLFSLSRFPGADARERGLRANLGVGWTRHDAAGWSLGMTAGRVLRADDLGQFGTGSGLSGTRSDWLLATHFSTRGVTLSNRALFDDDFSFTRDELRLVWAGTRQTLGAAYIWMEPDPTEGRDAATSELTLDTGWRWDSGWSGRFETRYDFTADRAARAGLGIEYRNECVTVDLSLSRRFTSSTSVRPETGFGLSVELAGFGAGGGGPRRVCAR